MQDYSVALSGFIVAAITAATAYLNQKLKVLDQQVNNKGRHNRTESLYELAHKNDVIAQQQLQMLKMIQEKVGVTEEVCEKNTRKLERIETRVQEEQEENKERFDAIDVRLAFFDEHLK
jgi:hypothetical protein